MEDHLNQTNTSTTSTEIDQTIDLKTLNSCLSVLTPHTIIQDAIQTHGLWQHASPVVRYLNAVLTKLNATHTLSVLDPVLLKEHILHPEKTASVFSPNWEPVILARKPLEGTVAENVLKWGTGGINVDRCRVSYHSKEDYDSLVNNYKGGLERATEKTKQNWSLHQGGWKLGQGITIPDENKGRWPANLLLDEEAAAMLDEQSGELSKGHFPNVNYGVGIRGNKFKKEIEERYLDSGKASRFFKICTSSTECSLCGMPYTKDNTIEGHYIIWKSLFVNAVEKSSWITPVTKANIVHANALQNLDLKLVQNVKSVGNLCDSCAMSIAVALVGTKTLDFKEEELEVILGYIKNYKRCILIQNLVQFVDLWENIDTTPTIQNLTILFGSVNHATTNYIQEIKKNEPLRFIYTPKSDSTERNKHLIGLGKKCNDGRDTPIDNPFQRGETIRKNHHPTVKPVDLLRYLCRLITPPGGVVLDPFAGSGSTGIAALEEGFDYILIEIDPEYHQIAKIRNAQKRIGEFA